MFPSTTNKFQKERKENSGYAVKQTKKILKKSKKAALKESTNEALNIMNESFEQTYGINFVESLVLSNCNLEKKPSREEKRQVKNSIFGKRWKKLKPIMNTLWWTEFMAVGIR